MNAVIECPKPHRDAFKPFAEYSGGDWLCVVGLPILCIAILFMVTNSIKPGMH